MSKSKAIATMKKHKMDMSFLMKNQDWESKSMRKTLKNIQEQNQSGLQCSTEMMVHLLIGK